MYYSNRIVAINNTLTLTKQMFHSCQKSCPKIIINKSMFARNIHKPLLKNSISHLFTANAKDVEVLKKVHGFWVIHLKN